jgi:uncharacterized damage-inducible protein DinB
MTEIARVADQLRRAYDGDAWHGPPLRKLLEGVTPSQATFRPRPHLHSIWELITHVTAVKNMVRRRLAGHPTELTPAEEWPPVPPVSDETWGKAIADLDAAHAELLAATVQLGEPGLWNTVPRRDYPVYVMLHGLVQHDLYHAGQVALLKSLAGPG